MSCPTVFKMCLSFLFVVCFSGNVEATLEPIPVLMWSPERRMSELDVNASPVESEDFHKSYLKPLVKDASATVLFLQDKLHTDDFTQFADVYSINSDGGAFANIRHLMDENFSLEVPQVSQPWGSLGKFQSEYKGLVHTVSSLEDLTALDLKPGQDFLLIVRLPASADVQDREAALQRSDKMIGEVCKHLQKQNIQYVAAYTGESPGKGMVSEGEVHSSRRLMATTTNSNGTLMNITGSSFLFMKDIYICVANKGVSGCVHNFTLVPTNSSASTSVVANKTAEFNLVFDEVTTGGETFDIKISQVAFDQGDRWVINRTSLFLTPTTGDQSKNTSSIQNGTLSPGEMDFVVPILYSFHCTEMKMYLDTVNNDFNPFEGTYVTFNGYQFQPFNVQKDRFFNSVDCVGFFTTAIWMGLFPVAILLIILLYGTLMLLNLSIMDRYDDPKGKTISVNTSGNE